MATIKKWLEDKKYDSVEVATVEGFQGREKRVIIISTVRGNSEPLKPENKFPLGFLFDSKVLSLSLLV